LVFGKNKFNTLFNFTEFVVKLYQQFFNKPFKIFKNHSFEMFFKSTDSLRPLLE